ncbi:MAG: membrane protein insertase YidC, partial [Pseudomonadota bacterium]
MQDNNRNTILAVALSIIVLIGWNYLYITPRLEQDRQAAEIAAQREATQTGQTEQQGSATIPQAAEPGTAPTGSESGGSFQSPSDALANNPRIKITSDLLSGSINLKGARFDDLKLNAYQETIDDDSQIIELLRPSGTENAYFAEFGYTPNKALGDLPGPTTVWNASSQTLAGNSSVTLDWTNDRGIRFQREIALDDQYMFTLTDRITNSTGDEIQLTPYGRIARFERPSTENIFVLHEGLIGFFGEEGLQEIDYGDVEDAKQLDSPRVDGGWLGITDKYWATALIPEKSFKPRFAYFDNGLPLYQSD